MSDCVVFAAKQSGTKNFDNIPEASVVVKGVGLAKAVASIGLLVEHTWMESRTLEVLI